MKTLRSLSVLISAAWLAACSPLPYKKAEGPGVATIKMTNASTGPITASESQGGDCRDLQSWGGVRDQIPRYEHRITHALPGGPWVFAVNGKVRIGYNSYSSCSFTMGMHIEPDGEYELRYVETDDGCRMEARKRIGSTWSPLELKKYQMNALIGPVTCTVADAR